MNILVLTSSRADFGIYLPVLNELKNDLAFKVSILAFGTHISKAHGQTINYIRETGFEPEYMIDNMFDGDSPKDIALIYANTVNKFSEFWSSKGDNFKYVLVLGDRYEMAAAVAAGIPFGIPFVHIHAGETTLGAIDNIYRHSITLASCMQFVAMETYKQKVRQLLGNSDKCFISGAPSIDNLRSMKLLGKDEFNDKWGIDLDKPTVLVTIHPETVDFKSNEQYANEVKQFFGDLVHSKQLVITMPNADTNASVFRSMFNQLKEEYPSEVFLIENFGTQSYFTCMKYCGLLIGNTSSGIIEAASFGKYVINLGNRQAGRASSSNVINLPFESQAIAQCTEQYFSKIFSGENIYGNGRAAEVIINKLKSNGA